MFGLIADCDRDSIDRNIFHNLYYANNINNLLAQAHLCVQRALLSEPRENLLSHVYSRAYFRRFFFCRKRLRFDAIPGTRLSLRVPSRLAVRRVPLRATRAINAIGEHRTFPVREAAVARGHAALHRETSASEHAARGMMMARARYGNRRVAHSIRSGLEPSPNSSLRIAHEVVVSSQLCAAAATYSWCRQRSRLQAESTKHLFRHRCLGGARRSDALADANRCLRLRLRRPIGFARLSAHNFASRARLLRRQQGLPWSRQPHPSQNRPPFAPSSL